MKPDLSFLSKIRTNLENLWGGAEKAVKGLVVKQPAEPPHVRSTMPDVNDIPAMQEATRFREQQRIQEQPAPTPYPRVTPEEILKGLLAQSGGKDIPVASIVQQLAELGNSLPDNIDPFFPAALSLRESGGGVTSGTDRNNPYGIMTWDKQGNRELAAYPDLATATLGGGPRNQMGLKGTLNNGLYENFLQSGNLSDFFNTYSPSGENASTEDQIALFNQLLKYFRQ